MGNVKFTHASDGGENLLRGRLVKYNKLRRRAAAMCDPSNTSAFSNIFLSMGTPFQWVTIAPAFNWPDKLPATLFPLFFAFTV